MTMGERHRKPRVFAADDPTLGDADGEAAGASAAEVAAAGAAPATPPPATARPGFGWGSLLVGALLGLAALATGVSFMQFVSVALARNDWIGWTAFALLAAAGLAALVLLLREIIGLTRLARLVRLRKSADVALRERDLRAERAVIRDLRSLFEGRPQLAWPLARFREHEAGLRDPGDLLALADRELMAPLDLEVRRVVLASARRVSVVTALSPMVLIAVVYVLIENLRMLRATATLYGGRPGLIGAIRLGRMVVGHLLATGGVALTDDLLGQFLGQDLLRRLSRRLGEGAFNGALTARIGIAAIEVIRPLPYLAAKPPRARDVLGEVLRPMFGRAKAPGA
jgi:putative membrane protein